MNIANRERAGKVNTTDHRTHSYSPRPAAWLLAGLMLSCNALGSVPESQASEPATDPALLPPVDIVLVWVGDRETAEPVAEAPATVSEPTLDLDGLESRLRQSDALGLFTKLELKNQVGDLIDEIEGYHGHQSELTLEQLEQRFDLLLMKLLVLLQDKDPDLHADISDARGALWATLSNPVQFASMKGP